MFKCLGLSLLTFSFKKLCSIIFIYLYWQLSKDIRYQNIIIASSNIWRIKKMGCYIKTVSTLFLTVGLKIFHVVLLQLKIVSIHCLSEWMLRFSYSNEFKAVRLPVGDVLSHFFNKTYVLLRNHLQLLYEHIYMIIEIIS